MSARTEMPKSHHLHCAEDARRMARRRLPRMMFDFIEGAAGREVASARNEALFDQIELQPRVMTNVALRNQATNFLGQAFQHPYGIAPMGLCDLAWPGADRMLAAAAQAFDIPLCLSSAASSSLEDMRNRAGRNIWFQLYVHSSADAAMGNVDRAERAGYDVLILTVDVPQVSRRVRDLRNGFQLPFRMGPRQFLDFALHPRWSLGTLLNGVPTPRNLSPDRASTRFDRGASRAGADWSFLDRLRKRWTGKLIVKGVTSTEDAIRIRDAGADAVYVSNHGGRQLDSAPPAICILPRIRAAVGPDYPLVFDSGVNNGEDIAKALALGADFVMLGRPVLFSIGAEGERGLHAFLSILAEDIDLALAQLGLTDVGQLSLSSVVNAPSHPQSDTDNALRVAASRT